MNWKICFRGLTAGIFLVGATMPAHSQAVEEGRVFTTIAVTGNERFRDGDIRATADLQPGVPYTEADLISAVEALEFTGEFKTVRIFSSGETLTISVDEEEDYTGNLTFGLGGDSDIGIFGTIGLTLENVLGGKSVSADLTYAEQVVIGRASISSDQFWPGERAGGVRLEYAKYDYDNTLFDFETASIQPFVQFGDASDGLVGEFRLTALHTDISDIDGFASSILQAEAGDRFVAGPGVSAQWSGSGTSPWNIGLSVDVFGGEAQFAQATLAFSKSIPFVASSVLRTRGRLGAVEGFGGDNPTAVDRLTLGGTSMRGFARGGVSPVDECLGCGAAGENVVTRLGGERFAVLQTDLLFPTVSERLPFTPGLFFDVGSVWNVDTPTAASGVLIDDIKWRSSAGIAATAQTSFGDFSASYAITTNDEDFDDTQKFTLSFTSEF
jgi:outer membrane protein insertion porin family